VQIVGRLLCRQKNESCVTSRHQVVVLKAGPVNEVCTNGARATRVSFLLFAARLPRHASANSWCDIARHRVSTFIIIRRSHRIVQGCQSTCHINSSHGQLVTQSARHTQVVTSPTHHKVNSSYSHRITRSTRHSSSHNQNLEKNRKLCLIRVIC